MPTKNKKIIARPRRVRIEAPKPKKKSKPFSRVGGIVGRRAGSMFGHADMGKRLGAWFGSGIGQLFGSGDYHSNIGDVSRNSIINPGPTDVPQVTGKIFPGKLVGETRFRKREYLTDIFSSPTVGGFLLQSLLINPGNPFCTPWLAEIAHSWEQYQIHGMIFEFKSMSGEYTGVVTTGTALGSVIMATQYDPSDPAFTTKFQMENYECAQSFKPSLNGIHGVECAKAVDVLSELFIADLGGVIPINSDAKFYNFGRFSIATVGCPTANTNLGELWVSYDISLFKMKLPTSVTAPGGVTTQSFHVARSKPVGLSIDFGDSTLARSGNITLDIAAGTITNSGLVPGSSYLVVMSWIVSGTTITASPNVLITSGSGRLLLTNTAATPDILPSNGAPGVVPSTSNTVVFTFTVLPDSLGVILFTLASTGVVSVASAKTFDYFITALDPSVTT